MSNLNINNETFLNIVIYIRNYVNERAPGLITALDLESQKDYNVAFINLLFSDPEKAVKILWSIYKNEATVYFVVEIFAKAISIKLDMLDKYHHIAQLILNRPKNFLELIYDKLPSA